MKSRNLSFFALVSFAAFVFAGCTSITTPDGAKYQNVLFAKQIGELEIEKRSGTNSTIVRAKGIKSDAQAVADTFQAGFQQGVNGLKVYTGQGATVQNNAPVVVTQEQVDEAVRRYQVRASNSTVFVPAPAR